MSDALSVPIGDYRAIQIKHLQGRVEVNDLGLPVGIYRADLLPVPEDPFESNDTSLVVSGNGSNGTSVLSSDASADLSDAAFVPLEYTEGFPTLPSGQPIWLRFDYEPLQAFQAFQDYLNQAEIEGTRYLFGLTQTFSKFDIDQLGDLYTLYHWDCRSRAYDLFNTALVARARQHRVLSMEDDHYLKAERLLNIAMEYIGGDEFEALLNPKVAIELLKVVTNLQRVSVGLPAQGPLTKNQLSGLVPGDHSPAASLEVVLRSIAKSSQSVHSGETSVTLDGDGKVVDAILDDEGSTALMQELIVRLSTKAVN